MRRPGADAGATGPEGRANRARCRTRRASPSRAASAPPAAVAASRDRANISASAASASLRPKLSSPVWARSPPWSGMSAEHRAEVRIFGDAARLGRGEIGKTDRNRVFWPETKLLARGAGRQEKAAADFLARHVEKDRGGMQDRRFRPFEPGGQKEVERAFAHASRSLANSLDRECRQGIFLKFAPCFNKAARAAQPLSFLKVNTVH